MKKTIYLSFSITLFVLTLLPCLDPAWVRSFLAASERSTVLNVAKSDQSVSNTRKPHILQEVVFSSDRRLSVLNRSETVGNQRKFSTKLQWFDGQRREQTFDDRSIRLGWVEQVAVFRDDKGSVYICTGEEPLSDGIYQVYISAFRMTSGADRLSPALNYLPQVEGRSEDGSRIIWRYGCAGPRTMPRPIEVHLLEQAAEIQIALRPEQKVPSNSSVLPQTSDNFFAYGFRNLGWQYIVLGVSAR